MALLNTAKKIIESVGKNNKPMYAVVAVAAANGIFKPLSTLMDKKESPETKKYTALREFLTECVAVPTYIASAKIAEKFANGIKNPEKAKLAKSNLSFLGVCTAAILVIPALCSVVIKPLTDRIYHRGAQTPQPAKVDTSSINKIYTPNNNNDVCNRYHKYSFAAFRNGGLKV